MIEPGRRCDDDPTVAHAGLAALALAVALAALAAGSGCIGVSQRRETPGVVGGRLADLAICRAGTRPATDGAIDDFEDDNLQLTPEGGRDGYWWTKKDGKGSTVLPEPFAPSDGGADGSEMALRGTGTTATGPDAWGAGFGFNFASQGGLYDASRYAGISFRARSGPGGATTVRLKIGDVNTHQSAHVCKSCWNHFGVDVNLTPEWKSYKVMFTEVRQEPYWGDPRPVAVTASKLVSVDWSIAPGQTYDVWVDDVRFIECR